MVKKNRDISVFKEWSTGLLVAVNMYRRKVVNWKTPSVVCRFTETSLKGNVTTGQRFPV